MYWEEYQDVTVISLEKTGNFIMMEELGIRIHVPFDLILYFVSLFMPLLYEVNTPGVLTGV